MKTARTKPLSEAPSEDASADRPSDGAVDKDASERTADLSALRSLQEKEDQRKQRDRDRKRAERAKDADKPSAGPSAGPSKPSRVSTSDKVELPEPVQVAMRTLFASIFKDKITPEDAKQAQANAALVGNWWLEQRLPLFVEDKWMPEVALGTVATGYGISAFRLKRAQDAEKALGRAPPKKEEPLDPSTGQPVPPPHPAT